MTGFDQSVLFAIGVAVYYIVFELCKVNTDCYSLQLSVYGSTSFFDTGAVAHFILTLKPIFCKC